MNSQKNKATKHRLFLENYQSGFPLDQLFTCKIKGEVLDKQHFFSDFSRTMLIDKIKSQSKAPLDYARIRKIATTSFDFIYYYPKNLLTTEPPIKNSAGIVVSLKDKIQNNIGISETIPANTFFSKNLEANCYYFPLYFYAQEDGKPNLDLEVIKKISQNIGIGFVPERIIGGEVCFANLEGLRPEFRNTFSPIDLLDYCYATLQQATYRKIYKESHPTDFPRIPFPKDLTQFDKFVTLGAKLRKLHLLEFSLKDKKNHSAAEKYTIGRTTVERVENQKNRKIYINNSSLLTELLLENISESVWNYRIGNYQAIKHWLSVRRKVALSETDINHLQKIVYAIGASIPILDELNRMESLIPRYSKCKLTTPL